MQRNKSLSSNHYRSLLLTQQAIRNRFIFFCLFLIYLLLSILSTTDKMLYMDTPIKMPLLSLSLPLVTFYIVMPIFVIILQFNLLYILKQYRKKLIKIKNKYLVDAKSIHFGLIEGAIFSNTLLNIAIRKVVATLILLSPPIVLFMFWFRFSDLQNQSITIFHFFLVWISILMAIALDPFFLPKEIRSKKNLVKLFIAYTFPIISFMMIYNYQMNLLMPFSDKNTSYIDLKKLYNKYNIKIMGIELLPRLVLSSELLIPFDNKLLEVLSNLDNTETKKPLLLYSLPLDKKGRNFRYAIFDNSIAIKTDFSKSNLEGSSFAGANLFGANFSNTKLNGANMQNANLKKSSFDHAIFYKNNFSNANFEGVKLVDLNLSGLNFEGADLSKSILRKTDLSHTDLSLANLSGHDFEHIAIDFANFSQANLRGAKFRRTNLDNLNFSFAKMQGSKLYRANLEKTNLLGAQLQGADLRFSRIIDSNLQAVNLTGSSLRCAKIHNTNIHKAKVQGSDLENIENLHELKFHDLDDGILSSKDIDKIIEELSSIIEDEERIQAITQRLKDSINLTSQEWIKRMHTKGSLKDCRYP